MSVDSIMDLVDQHSIRLVRFLFCDTSNIIRGKCSGLFSLRERLTSGIGIVRGAMATNMLDEPQVQTGYGSSGEVRLVPDLATFKPIPWVNSQAMVLCDLQKLDRTSFELCPRSILKAQVARCEKMGLRVEAAFEPEFFLGRLEQDEFVPLDRSNCFSSDGMNRAGPFITDFVACLESQGLSVEQYYPELGHGQHELSIRHVPALEAADNQIVYRETLRGVAQQHSLVASLAPKPGVDMPGNGCHLHLSLWDKDAPKNLFFAEDGLSSLGRHFIAGVLAHLEAVVALTCSSVNSYRRLKPRSWSSAFTCWGLENREAAVRVPSVFWGMEMETTNLEIKCVDSSANPYLALAAVIAAGLAGIEAGEEPPEPVDGDPSLLSADQAEKQRVRPLPSSLKQALEHLKVDRTIRQELGEEFVRVFLEVKSSEDDHFSRSGVEEELRAHFLRY